MASPSGLVYPNESVAGVLVFKKYTKKPEKTYNISTLGIREILEPICQKMTSKKAFAYGPIRFEVGLDRILSVSIIESFICSRWNI